MGLSEYHIPSGKRFSHQRKITFNCRPETLEAIDRVGFAQALTSLTSLHIGGSPDIDAESFPEEETGIVLPSSLTHLNITSFDKLKYLSSEGFQNLTSLTSLYIMGCPNLISFTEVGLPSLLLKVLIVESPLLKKQCKRNEG
ncbi:hypothetical protein Ddye_003115 [Dipteronia dyeriana]|uniref:Uncharacterized protein n=1 Tax=Dipteronia dyeriana TaxID=168575 RepID=A0AAE0CV26_9ROSI|nr:hypothetical protein Ddye_003115 [Dipteronia dyeriana]